MNDIRGWVLVERRGREGTVSWIFATQDKGKPS